MLNSVCQQFVVSLRPSSRLLFKSRLPIRGEEKSEDI